MKDVWQMKLYVLDFVIQTLLWVYTNNTIRGACYSVQFITCTAQKPTIHQVTIMSATSKTVLLPGRNHLLTIGTDDPILIIARTYACTVRCILLYILRCMQESKKHLSFTHF